MMNTPGQAMGPAEYAPVNESARPGMVAYLATGAGFVVRARRADAYKQMHAACGGNYQIASEGPGNGSGYLVAGRNGSMTYVPTTYWYIQFDCVSRPVPVPAGLASSQR